ncbi:MAG: DUF58 domain-containing protein [Solirubrobacteraceae bacterium]|nr:DUF58 domain-containing protein [Solirubrobacteraceae bacterium]
MTSSLIINPPGQQGPGRTPPAAVAALDLAIARRAAGRLPGDHLAAGVGAGTELQQLRPYVEGDDLRQLDAAASARTNEPHVRLHVPERALTTWVLLDISPSMAFGSDTRLKSDVAAGAATVISRLATRRGGRIGLMRWGSDEEILVPPRGGRNALGSIDRTIRAGVAADGTQPVCDFDHAIRRLGLLARQPGLVAIVSDFRDTSNWPRALSALAHRHRVIAVEVSDPREHSLPDAGSIVVRDPETGRDLEINTGSRKLREAYAAQEAKRREYLRSTFRRSRVKHVPVMTNRDWLRDLGTGIR